MNRKFQLLMDAIDEDLLEEAIVPVKKKNPSALDQHRGRRLSGADACLAPGAGP